MMSASPRTTAIDATVSAIADARPYPRVHLDGDHVQDVGAEAGADLLPARHEAVEDASGDHEVRARVVVRERETRV
jgi:hypothetical protein